MHVNSSRRKLSLAFAGLVCRAAALGAQSPAPSSQVIRRSIDLVTSDVIVRDAKGTFIPDLNKSDFEVSLLDRLLIDSDMRFRRGN